MFCDSFNCTNEYLVVDRGEYLCIDSVHEVIAAWLHASQICPDGGVGCKPGENVCM